MKSLAIVSLALMLSIVPTQKGNCSGRDISITNLHEWQMDDVEYEIDDRALFLSHDGRKFETIEITEEYELFINDEQIKLDAEQQGLVKDYYDHVMEIVRRAKKIGWEGVRIGLSGAHLGLKAVGGVVEMIFTSYDEDEFERDMDIAAAKLESQAEKLEEKAEILEDLADEMEDIAEQMQEKIPEIRKLRWF